MTTLPGRRARDREILRLAVPAFLALVAEPLFLLADAAIVGHLGTPELAALGIAGAVVQTAVGLCIFQAYGTTASVARRVGAGDPEGGELRRAEVADDRSVGEQEQRLGDQGQEGRHREPQDLPVPGPAARWSRRGCSHPRESIRP